MSDEPRVTITWTRAKRDKLRAAYKRARKDDLDTIMFEGHLLVVGYAKYLLEFLDMQFADK